MQENLISFIIPNRGGLHVMDVVDNINETFPEYEKEIIVVEQCDVDIFKKGQLFNIAMQRCNGKYVAMQDNDIIHLRHIDLLGILEQNNMKPYLGFTHTSQIPGPRKPYLITDTKLRPFGYGAFLFGLKDSFVKANGYSNLYMGWGSEDVEFGVRIADGLLRNGMGNVYRVPQDIAHISHLHRSDPNRTAYNDWLFRTRRTRDAKLDGINNTTSNIILDGIIDGVRYIRVSNITVRQPFAYNHLLKNRL